MVKKSIQSKKTLFWLIAAGAILLLIQTALSGCAVNYGRLETNSDITKAFKAKETLPDHKYYYTGRESLPDAVVGIHRDYKMDSKLWKEIDLTTIQLGKMISNVFPRPGHYPARGAYILDPSGKTVGVWYSTWYWTPIRVETGNRIVIDPPASHMVGNGAK